jgi:hypothetical protein
VISAFLLAGWLAGQIIAPEPELPPTPPAAQEKAATPQQFKRLTDLAAKGVGLTLPVRVFSHVLVIDAPSGFAPASQTVQDGSYVLRLLSKGETSADWRRMVRVTGQQALLTAGLGIDSVATTLMAAEAKDCPAMPVNQVLGQAEVSGFPAVIFMTGCSDVGETAMANVELRGEQTVTLAIAAAGDLITVQSAVRGAAFTPEAPLLSEDVARNALRDFGSIYLCALAAEAEPCKTFVALTAK